MEADRYIIDYRAGGITVRDTHNPFYLYNMKDPLDFGACDVVFFYDGYPGEEPGKTRAAELRAICQMMNAEQRKPFTLNQILDLLNKEVL